MDYEELRQKAEELIRSGRRTEARALLMRLKGKPLPRARASQFATLARRAGLIQLALEIMAPIVRPKTKPEKEATDEEKATYAVILLVLGASTEALEILRTARDSSAEVILSLAFTHINRWDYAEAIKFLRRYLKLEGIGDYQQMIAKVNLAASYVAAGNSVSGKPLLAEIRETTHAKSWGLLHKNSLELSAQLAIQEQDWEAAKDMLARAMKATEQTASLDDFFIRKWQAIADVQMNGREAESLRRLLAIREDAVRIGHWETIRDCDFHRALALRDESLARKLYFGTPYERFRTRLLGGAKGWLEIPASYDWQLGEGRSERIFDLRRAEEREGISLKVGKSLHSALRALTSDFYRPLLIGSFHAAVFPGEHFNPQSSPGRLGFLVHRLRAWLRESEIPVTVAVGRDGYRLKPAGDYAFRVEPVAKAGSAVNPYDIMIEKLGRETDASLSTSQIAAALGISERSARTFAKWATEHGRLAKRGSGKLTRYDLPRRRRKAA